MNNRGRKCPFICFYCWEPQSFHEAAALFIKFDIQYSMSAARLSEMFSIFVGAEQSALHTDESVFALSLIRNVVVSMRKGRTDSTLSSLLDYVARGILHPLAPHIYLGVEYWNRLFSSGPYHSLLSDRRNQLHTFFFINRQSLELRWGNYAYVYKHME